ncbi:copper resistance protein B [Cupriavidus necator]|uniref:copper resistance protein B n=1 Tax=Cupriavidus necator TaxID=106590 RepID=UPI0038B27FA3
MTPDFEANAYSKTDEARGIGSGLADLKIGLRLRYEIRRQFAFYIGVGWGKKLGNTQIWRELPVGERTTDKQIVAGVRVSVEKGPEQSPNRQLNPPSVTWRRRVERTSARQVSRGSDATGTHCPALRVDNGKLSGGLHFVSCLRARRQAFQYRLCCM